MLPDDDDAHLTESAIKLGCAENLQAYWIRVMLKFTELT